PLHEIARSHAGYVGEMAWRRFWSTGWPVACDEYLERVKALTFGGCDDCQMAFTAWKAVGIRAPIEDAREVMMKGQRLALEIGQRRDVQNAIRALAAALMEQHTLTSADAHEIIEKYI